MNFTYYKIQNKINKKIYIGITKSYSTRIRKHILMLNKNKHFNYKLQKEWNTYGEENFIFEIIEIKNFSSLEEGYNYEKELIDRNNCLESGYNLAVGGKVNPMYSKQVKEKMIRTKQSQVPNIYQLEEIEENIFKIVGKFNSQKEAQKITGFSQRNIHLSIYKKVKGSGFYWITEEQLVSFESTWRPVRTRITPTAELNDNGEIVKVHHNRSIFEREYGMCEKAITSAIKRNGKAQGKKFINIDIEKYYKIKPIKLI